MESKLFPHALARAAAAACVLVALAPCGPAHAQTAPDLPEAQPWWRPDAVFAQLGRGNHVESISMGATWDWDWHRQYRAGLLTGYTEATAGRWRGTAGLDDTFVSQFGITPVLRLYPGGTVNGWFVEGGIGANAITPRYENGTRRFSTVFNFGDHVGVGRRFGEHAEHEIALRVEHFSNGETTRPNPGENFVQLRYVQRF